MVVMADDALFHGWRRDRATPPPMIPKSKIINPSMALKLHSLLVSVKEGKKE